MERELLQIAFAVAGLVLVGFGFAGVFFGANFLDLSGNVVMDSYIRFLKGMLLAIGLIYWSSIPDIERHGERMSLVTFILVLGAVPRLMAVIAHGVPTIGIMISLIGELIVAPLLWLWQRRVARAARRNDLT
jgi:Flp pilus assembly protein TadB